MSTTLSVSLKKPLIWLLIAVVALSIATLTALPTIAQAQQTSEPSERQMVYPGDSLWSISQRHLGPQASPQQIANEAERIFELNRDRMEDPSMLMPGEELLLAPSVSEPATEQSANEPENVPAAAAVEPAAQPPVAASEASEPAAETASGATLDIPAELEAYLPNERKLLGLGVIILTLALAILILWKLPMRRDIGTEAWGISAMASYQAPRRISTNEVSGEPTFAPYQPQKSSRGFTSKSPANGLSDGHVDLASTKPVRRKLSLVSRSPLSRKRRGRNGWATSVHNPQVRLALKRMPRTSSSGVALPMQKLSHR